jgi:thiol:disulfide interchange protein DsbA
MIKKGLLILLPLLLVAFNVQADFDEGIEYIALKTPVKTSSPDNVVVTELFWYGCPHCFRFEPYINRWQKNIPDGVIFEQVPSVLNPSWAEHARTFYALEIMGVTDKVHQKLFEALHVKNKRLNSLDTLATFVAEQGVDEKQFRDTYYSFPVETLIRKSKQKERKYGHQGVPAIVVNGKYRTSATLAGSNARMIEVIDFLVERELKQK